MKTDDLIAQLSEAPEPIPPHAAARTLLGGLVPGAFIAFAFTALALGFRRDFATAVTDWQYWAKFAYTLTFAALAFPVVKRLSHPGASGGPLWRELLAPLAVLGLGALGQWTTAPAEQHMRLLFGGSFLVCPWLIVAVSLPVFAGTIAAMRKLAPTDPNAGLAAGLFAGAAGAFIYGFHCNETSLVFVAIWYTAGILLTGLIGLAAGRALLRW